MSDSNQNFAEVGPEATVDASARGDGQNILDSSDTHPIYLEELHKFLQWANCGKEVERRKEVLKGSFEKSCFRSIVWQILLDILPHQSCLWVEKLRQLRNNYRSRRDVLLIDPRSASASDNPLSQDDSSAWHQYFCDKELRSTIRKDVVRTSPGDKFFSSESIQNTMVNILFVYAREHQEICYRQGMHEVLATLLLVLHADQQALIEAQKVTSIEGLILEVLDSTCLEEDTYWLLKGIMKHLTSTYTILDVIPTSTGEFPYQSAKHMELESEVCSRMRKIRDNILEEWDPDLRQHLVTLDIPLYFGIRWLRVLFGQEFSKRNLLVLWDAIFAADCHFGLVDVIVVAMLMVIRDRLLEEDFYGCLDLLVHYPAENQVHSILRLALHMLKPKEFHRPDDIVVETKRAVGFRSSSISGRIRDLVYRPRLKVDPTSSANIQSLKRSFKFKGNRSEEVNSSQLQRHSRFSTRNLDDSTERLTTLQNKVYLISLRLAKYHDTLEQHLNSSVVPTSVMNAVEGVKEIANMLEELGGSQSEVETAIEATQSPNVSSPNSPDPNAAMILSDKTRMHPTLTSKLMSTRGKPLMTELLEISGTPSNSVSDLNFLNPLRNMYGTSDFEPVRIKTRYLQYQRHLGEGRIFARMNK